MIKLIRLPFFLLSYVFLCLAAPSTISGASSKHETEPPHYFISVCAIFQNEAPYLREWIEYHRIIGVEHFYLFNNESVDDYMQVLNPYIAKGIVELWDWPRKPNEAHHVGAQIAAYNHCIALTADISDWLALIDLDEFILPISTKDLTTFLSQYDNEPNVGGIKINWQVFGTSHLATLPTDKPMIESLTLKAPWNYEAEHRDPPDNAYIKMIVRPKAVSRYRIHDCSLKSGFYTLPKPGKGQRMTPIKIDEICLNHYWTRAEDFFYTTKVNRRLLKTKPPSYQPRLEEKLITLNTVEDKTIFKYLPQLKKRLAEKP